MEKPLSTKEAAALLGLHPMTLAKQRAEGKGAVYSRLGRRIVYEVSDLQAYVKANKVAPTV